MAKDSKKDIKAPSKVADEKLMTFEEWYALREGQIPTHHYKEIIKADFMARKVLEIATLSEFDLALKKYGIELND